jgi:hypothetical protein
MYFRVAKKSQDPYIAEQVDLYVQLCAVYSAPQHMACTTDTDSVATHHLHVSKRATLHGTHTEVHTVTK